MEFDKTWYFVCSVYVGGPMHVEHDFCSRSEAEKRANDLFTYGIIADGENMEFDQVICVSESHEICFHSTKNN